MSDKPTKEQIYKKVAELTARIDRLPTMVLPISVILALAFGYFIALYDVIDIGIAFSGTSLPYTGLTSTQASIVVSMGLAGYIPGAIILGYFADKYGRKPMLMFTALLTAIGSLGNALSFNFPMFIVFRFITGMGIGGDLILVPTYIVEMVPAVKRGQYFNLVYIAGWAGLGLGPFLASVIDLLNPAIGWRVIFLIGATLAFIVLVIRSHASETVRILALKGKLDEAEKIVAEMEEKAIQKTGIQLPPYNPLNYKVEEKNPFTIFKNKKYAIRIISVMLSIFFFYFGEYPYLTQFLLWAGGLSNLTKAQINELTFLYGLAGVATFLGAIALRFIVEKVRRAILTTLAYFVGMLLGVLIATIGTINYNVPLAFGGMLLTNFIGVGWSNQLNYLNGTENVPTYARATSFAFSDGAAHLGAAISTAIILPIISSLGALPTWVLFQVPMVIMGIVLIFVLPNTIGQSLEKINEAEAGV
ncbi:MFS transporter [Sulfurisphaera tokodaii]|uniref:MFS transporter n=2 Tax=Sulfurisphaera tokodaii TaxID=111955 RepID=Q96XR3_SULTO|nr:MFS transporter [Sulfurisphaera tokodaii]BAB67564.1 MFS transporter [Sulfurisphaera tokodaii str. 7]HII74563.1 MFS transporter [Sulfurisphaera tokodaii]